MIPIAKRCQVQLAVQNEVLEGPQQLAAHQEVLA